MDSPPPARSSTAVVQGNPHRNRGGTNDTPSSLPPPAAPPGEIVADPSPSSLRYGPRQPGQRSNSTYYDLFLAAVGLTPRGLAAGDGLSPRLGDRGTGPQAEEEDFWSAHGAAEENGPDAAEYSSSIPSARRIGSSAAGAMATATARGDGEGGAGGVLGGQLLVAADDESAGRMSGTTSLSDGAAVVAADSALAAQAEAHLRPRHHSVNSSDHDGESNSPARTTPVGAPSGAMDAAAGVEGTTRRRRRILSGFGAAVAGSEPESRSTPSPQRYSDGISRAFRRGNPLFRSGDRGLFSRSNVVAGSGNLDGEDGEGGNAAGAGTRAVERAINRAAGHAAAAAAGGWGGAAAVMGVGTSGGAGGGTASRAGCGSNSLDASETRGGAGVGGSGSSANSQGQILFYQKPTLANVSAGDVPDVVPVYLECPRGNMALGLPLNDAWQGERQQETTFNQNLSYTILSWPEDHVQDLLELWRLQVLFFTTIIFNTLLSALLFFTDNPDRTRVEGFARAGAFPGPFQQRSSADEPTGLRSKEWHLAVVLILSLLGAVCILARLRAGVALYLVLTIVNAIVGLNNSPDPLFACRYAVDLVLVAIGRSYLSSLTYNWVTASAGDGRRGW